MGGDPAHRAITVDAQQGSVAGPSVAGRVWGDQRHHAPRPANLAVLIDVPSALSRPCEAIVARIEQSELSSAPRQSRRPPGSDY